ncbi:MAG: hypothetical protein ACYCS1_05345 [Gammaproteobacteria bacterium]
MRNFEKLDWTNAIKEDNIYYLGDLEKEILYTILMKHKDNAEIQNLDNLVYACIIGVDDDEIREDVITSYLINKLKDEIINFPKSEIINMVLNKFLKMRKSLLNYVQEDINRKSIINSKYIYATLSSYSEIMLDINKLKPNEKGVLEAMKEDEEFKTILLFLLNTYSKKYRGHLFNHIIKNNNKKILIEYLNEIYPIFATLLIKEMLSK